MSTHGETDQPNTLLAALSYARIGLRVLPIRPVSKAPMLNDWPTRATTNPDTIKGWWAQRPNAGVGLAMGAQPDGRHIVAVDIDNHNPAELGADTIRDLEDAYGALPDTWSAITGSGGQHLLFLVPPDAGIRNDAGRLLGPGADIRGDGGQIVVAPTVHPNNRRYEWEDGHAPWEIEIAPAPGWLIALLTADRHETPPEPPRDPYTGGERPGDRFAAAVPWQKLLEPDGATNLGTTRAGISLWSRPGLEGNDRHTSATTGAVKNCLHVFTTGWPGLPPGNYTKFEYLTVTQFDGDHSAAAAWLRANGYGPPESTPNTPNGAEDTQPAQNRIRANFHMGPAIWDLPAVEWLIEDTIQTDGLTVIYGAPKSFKTFVTLDMAMHMANGRNWRGIPTKPTTVLYVVAEGAPGVGPRARAWCNRHGGTVDRIGWITVAPNLFAADGDTWHVGEIAQEIGAGLVIVDTLARAMPGGDENSAKDIGYVVANFDSIREQAGCALIAVHHTGKDAARGMRGSSSLQGAVDTSLEVVGDANAVNVRVADQKNAESDRAWWFKPTREKPSLVLEPTTGTGSSDDTRDANILRQLVLMDTGSGVGASAWATAVADRGICGDTTFYERLKAIKDGGLIDNRGTDKRPRWALTAAGRDAQDAAIKGR